MNLKSMIVQAISKNLAAKDETLDAILDNSICTKKKNRERMKMPGLRWVKKPVAVAFAAALIMATSIITIAINFNKTATLELTAVNQSGSSVVAPGDTVTLTVKTSNQKDFTEGIVGLTMDIAYDSNRLMYRNETITSLLDDNFSVYANEEPAGTIRVLLYADGKALPLSGAGDGDLFSLEFTVKSDAKEGECAFSPVGYELADYTDGKTGFELINVDPMPEAATVTVTKLPTINTSVTGNVGGTVTGGGQTPKGDNNTITITPESGFYISSVLVDGSAINLNDLDSPDLALNKANSYTIEDVQADHSIEVTFKKIFYMVPGASIRLADEAALRFVTEVSEEFLDDLEAKNIDYSLGTLIVPEDLVEGELTRETSKVKNIVQTMWQDDFFDHTEGYHVMTGVLTNIPEANYSRDLAGRVYIQIGGETIYTNYTKETNVRSLAYVAHMAKTDLDRQPLENYYSQTQIAKLEKYAAHYTSND